MKLNAATIAPIIISIIFAIAILASAYLLKGTKYDDAWIFIIVAQPIATAFYGKYSRKSNTC